MKQYLDMMRHVRENGVYKGDRTGTGTYSVFGYQMRFNLADGFPIVTTKLCHLRSIIHELLWFLNGETNIRYLKDNGVSIWDEWVLKGTEDYRLLSGKETREKARKVLGFGEFGLSINYTLPRESTLSADEPHRIVKSDDGTTTVFINAEKHPELKDHKVYGNSEMSDWFYRGLELLGVKDPHRELVAGELGPVYGSQWRNWPVAQQSTVDALIELSCLGNGNRWGNSDGNCIAQKALLDIPGIVHNKQAYMSSGYSYQEWLELCSRHADKSAAVCGEKGGIDQIANLVNSLKNNPNSRRHIVTAWNPLEVDHMALPPCHCLYQFYTSPMEDMERWVYGANNNYFDEREGRGYEGDKLKEFLDRKGVPAHKLSCQLYQRSADTFLGVPFNIASYALLTMMLAQVCDMALGEFIWTGGDVHIYSNHLEQVDLQLSRTPHPLPKMIIKDRGQGLDEFVYEDFELLNYVHDAAIKAPIAV